MREVCANRFEVFRKRRDEPLVAMPRCRYSYGWFKDGFRRSRVRGSGKMFFHVA